MTTISELLEKEQMEIVQNYQSMKVGIPLRMIISEDQKIQLSKLGIEIFSLNPNVLFNSHILQSINDLRKDYILERIVIFGRLKPKYEQHNNL